MSWFFKKLRKGIRSQQFRKLEEAVAVRTFYEDIVTFNRLSGKSGLYSLDVGKLAIVAIH